MANTLRFKRGLASGIPTALAGEPLFTTDTFDLYIGNGSGNTRFQKYIASGATTQILRGDGSLYTFPLAISSPTNGQVLKYNGTSWVNDSDSGITGSGSAGQVAYFTGATTQDGSNNLFWDNTNVRLGIGNPSPTTNLVVRGNTSGYDKNIIVWERATDGAVQGTLGFGKTSGGAYDNNVYVGSITNHPLLFQTNNAEAARIFATGNFGINTGATDSGEKLQVTGTMKVTGATTIGGALNVGTSGSLSINAGSAATPLITQTTNYTEIYRRSGGVGIYLGGTGDPGNYYDNTVHYFRSSGGVSTYATINSSGNLGLGVTPNTWTGTGVKAIQFQNGTLAASNTRGLSLSFNAYFDGGYKYVSSSLTTGLYEIGGNEHIWYTAPSGTAGNAITFTQAMTLDASGRLGIGVTSPSNKLDVLGTAASPNLVGTNAYARFYQSGGYANVAIGALSGGSYASWIQSSDGVGTALALSLQPSGGNLLIGSTSDSGEKLQVNGTAKVTGATAINAALTVTTTAAGISLVQSSVGSATYYVMQNTVETGGKRYRFGYTGASLDKGSFSIYNETDNITPLLIATSGAATFSSSVTANGTMQLINDGTYAGGGYKTLAFTGNTNGNHRIFAGVTDDMFFAAATSRGFEFRANGGTTANLYIASTGAATFNSSIQAGTAIAIGTTPDTNNPFKILKNINATVGIKFENTNTSSLAFSAVQLGTDVSGGTKFTNLVYASSGVTASGVYNPDGTSLINNGNGGLNFLGNPIRMYTGGSNGVLRWDISNEGIIQYNATSPTTSATDAYKQYSADVTAGNAAPHFRTENGAVIKLYQETTSVGNSIISLGGGSAVLDDTTFDGYTLRQIVKALRNQGILA